MLCVRTYFGFRLNSKQKKQSDLDTLDDNCENYALASKFTMQLKWKIYCNSNVFNWLSVFFSAFLLLTVE